MAIEQEGAAEAVHQQSELSLNRFVIGAVRLAEAIVELLGRDRASPQIAMLLGSGRNDSEAAAGAGADSPTPGAVNHRGIDFIFRAVAIDGSARRPRDYRAAAALKCAPYQPVDQRIFKNRKGRLSP